LFFSFTIFPSFWQNFPKKISKFSLNYARKTPISKTNPNFYFLKNKKFGGGRGGGGQKVKKNKGGICFGNCLLKRF